MKILAIDTSSFPASCAVAEDGVILGEYIIRNKRKHSQNIMPMVESMLNNLEIDISDIDMYAVTCGPGSFTGLRIGISTVRAFAQAMSKPVVSVNTLEALAFNFAGSNNIVIPMLDARRDEVFTAAYSFENNTPKAVLEPCVMTVNRIMSLFCDRRVIYTGDGAIAHREELLGENVIIASANLAEVQAAAVAAIADLKQDEAVHYNKIEPLYLRKSQAEREYDNKMKKETV